MRYKEFKLNEAELLEAKMSPARMKAEAEKLGAVAGMEFEMIVPNVSLDDGPINSRPMNVGNTQPTLEPEREPVDRDMDMNADEEFPFRNNWKDRIKYFFSNGSEPSPYPEIQRAIEELTRDYMDWEKTEITNITGRDSMTDDERAQFRSPVNFRSFLDSIEMRSMRDFGEMYDLEWPYYTDENEEDYYDDDDGDNSFTDAVRSFVNAVGRDANYSAKYHSAKRENGKYAIEGDGSLEPETSRDSGVEFISPTLPLTEMLDDLQKVLAWASRTGCYTGSQYETGLHINVSIPSINTREKLDYVKLVLFLGDHHILNEFDRYGNSYCESSLDLIYNKAANNPNQLIRAMDKMQNNFNQIASRVFHDGETYKRVSVNNKGNYIEFRGPGGEWISNAKSIPDSLYRMVWALNVASDPQLYRKEYYKKLSDLLGAKSVQYYDPKDPKNAKQPSKFNPVRQPGNVPHITAGDKSDVITKLRELVVDFTANGGRYSAEDREKLVKRTIKNFGHKNQDYNRKTYPIPGVKPLPGRAGYVPQQLTRPEVQPEIVAPGLQRNQNFVPPQVEQMLRQVPDASTGELETTLDNIRNNRGHQATRLSTAFDPSVRQHVIQTIENELNRRNQEAGDVPEEQ